MDKLDRLLNLYKELHSRRYPVSRDQLEQILDCSGVTVKRYIAQLRDFFNLPIEYDREHKGYYLNRKEKGHEVPGLWLTAHEIHALLAIDTLLGQLEPGLLRSETAAFRQRLDLLLRKLGEKRSPLERIRLLSMAKRKHQNQYFPLVAQAVLKRRQLQTIYTNRYNNNTAERVLSPQRLTHYRDNWYLDAWCHHSKGLRVFSLDRLKQVKIINTAALDIEQNRLDAELSNAYGIFSGQDTQQAILLFSAYSARWVADEIWHSAQIGYWRDDGNYELHLPYCDATELIGDILRYGDQVEVLSPPSLRNEIAAVINKMYKKTNQRIRD